MGRLESIDRSLSNIWRSWYIFRAGKKRNQELDAFTYYLEEQIQSLYSDLNTGNYQHGTYRTFTHIDTKRRQISVATTRDKIVHRLVYDYLIEIFNKTFVYDAWSCRVGKGVIGAIERTHRLLAKYPYAFVWRADITKFFDSVNHDVLKQRIRTKVTDKESLRIIENIIDSYSITTGTGIPIGNLSSQVFTNIYLHELDWYIFHVIKPLGYVRYGDDFIVTMKACKELESCKKEVNGVVSNILKLRLHSKNNIIVPVRQGVHFLGCDIYPTGRRLRKRVYNRILKRLSYENCSSYRALVIKHSKQKMIQWIDWNIRNLQQENL